MRTSNPNQRSSGIWDWATWIFCQVCFCCPSFQHAVHIVTSTLLGFLCVQFPQQELSLIWVSVVLGLHLVGTGTDMSVECATPLVLSHCKKDLKWQCYSSVTAHNFIWLTKDSTDSMLECRLTSKEMPQHILASSFYMFCLLHLWACPIQIGIAKKGTWLCLFQLKFSLWFLDFLLFHFGRIFPFFVFWSPTFWALSSLTT